MYREAADSIRNRILANNLEDVDKSEGNLIYNNAAANSEEFSNQRNLLDEILLRVYAQTAAENGFDEDLEKRCKEFGVFRKTGTTATCIVEFIGNDGTVIPSGTIIQTDSLLQYKTQNQGVVVNGKALVPIESVGIGKQYNVPIGAINQLANTIIGIFSVSSVTATIDGLDKESNTDLFARQQAKANRPSASGNPNDYKIWALEVQGVGSAKVFPLWAGNGTVKVVILNSDKSPADLSIIEAVASNIEEKRPVGPTVTVVSASGLTIEVAANVIKNSAYSNEQVISNVKSKVEEYIKTTAFLKSEVSYARINEAVLGAEGVLDVNTLVVNGGVLNVGIGPEQVAVLEVVTLSVT